MSPEIESKLRPHQIAPARHLLSALASGNAVDMSFCGLGKTYIACAIVATLNLPTLVVAPKIVLSDWQRVAAYFGDSVSVVNYEMLRAGNTPYGQWSNPKPKKYVPELCFSCQTCQQKFSSISDLPPCPVHHAGIHCLGTRRVPWDSGRFEFDAAIKFLIFDEVHRCSAVDSQNAEMLIAARRQNIKILGLSATMACGPLQMRALGYALDLFPLTQFYNWARRHGCGKIPGLPGFRWMLGEARQLEVMDRIRDSIIPSRGVSVSKASIPNFPKCQICVDLYDIEHHEDIDEIYKLLADPLAQLDDDMSSDIAPESPLRIQLRARQRLELLKLPTMLELGADYLAKGYSVVYFVNFQATLDELRRLGKVECVIRGGQTDSERARNLAAFQSNVSKCLGAIAKAGGVGCGMHDLHGGHPRVGVASIDFDPVTVQQLFGRLPRDSAKSDSIYRVVLAANTIEEQIAKAIRRKLNNLGALNGPLTNTDLFPQTFTLRK
jgi:hypothetical protein